VSCVNLVFCWAVGTSGHDGSEPSLIEHWNGTAWSIVA